MRDLTRRQLARLGLLALAATLPGCHPGRRYGEREHQSLERQRAEEARHAGKSRFGELRFRGYRELAKLPFFELTEQGRLRLLIDDLPPGIDFHTHLGFNLLFAPNFDLQRRTAIQYLLDCDRPDRQCQLDLDTYINTAFDEQLHDDLEHEFIGQLVWGSAAAETHTIPNLVGELDEMRFGQAAVLPIAAGLPFRSDPTERWIEAIARSPQPQRLIPFASVHPEDSDKRDKLRRFAAAGARGVKLHPEMQRFFPDDDGAMEIYEECERLGLPIIFHCGRSGIEPEAVRPYALPRWFAAPALEFPKVQFVMGHAGARDADEAVRLAQRFDNVWLEITGQGISSLDGMIRQLGTDRLLFGSDWPFYPLAATLAKVLLVTEDPAVRGGILRDNALRCFATAARAERAPT
ncbi:MAG TPA: amidohydrolase family protein [Terriglobales bacterium]|nr:amidohydrolase family protein [Terriglobales bacterium]